MATCLFLIKSYLHSLVLPPENSLYRSFNSSRTVAMFVSCKQATFLALGVASLALSAAINNDVLQSRDGKNAEPAQESPGCEFLERCSAVELTYISE